MKGASLMNSFNDVIAFIGYLFLAVYYLMHLFKH